MSNEARVMSYEKTKITTFTDLYAWKEGHKLVLMIYKSTGTFPSEERYGLTSQMRRSAVSVTSNIAEGFSRFTPADRVHFYVTAQGSLTELQNQLIIARDIAYMPADEFHSIATHGVIVHKLLTGLIKATRLRK